MEALFLKNLDWGDPSRAGLKVQNLGRKCLGYMSFKLP